MRNAAKDIQRLHIDELIPDAELFPLCVPSYGRPKARLLQELKKDPSIPVILFVRDYERDAYAEYKGLFRIVGLKNVHNLGETRRAMVNYCSSRGIDSIFMFDDDIYKFDYLIPGKTKSGDKKLQMPETTEDECPIDKTALKLWAHYTTLCNNLALSSITYRTLSWMWGNTKVPWRYNSGYIAQAFHVNVRLLKEHGLNFVSSDVCFNEDKYIQFVAMQAGLNTMSFKEFSYSVKTAGNGEQGGCSEMYGLDKDNSKEQLFRAYKEGTKRYMQNVCGGSHPGVIRKKNGIGMYEIKFDWKYWRKDM